MNEMREVKVKRITGKTYGTGLSRGTTNSQSSSYGGGRPQRNRTGSATSVRNRSSKKVQMSVHRTWVCKGCKAPKSDMSPTARNALLIFFGLLGLWIYSLFPPSTSSRDSGEVVTVPADSQLSNNAAEPVPTEPPDVMERLQMPDDQVPPSAEDLPLAPENTQPADENLSDDTLIPPTGETSSVVQTENSAAPIE